MKPIGQTMALAALRCWSTCVFCTALTTADFKNLPSLARVKTRCGAWHIRFSVGIVVALYEASCAHALPNPKSA